jgi:hypothetical protein
MVTNPSRVIRPGYSPQTVFEVIAAGLVHPLAGVSGCFTGPPYTGVTVLLANEATFHAVVDAKHDPAVLHTPDVTSLRRDTGASVSMTASTAATGSAPSVSLRGGRPRRSVAA